MAIKVNIREEESGKVLTISVIGRFDLNSYGEFSAAYKDNLEGTTRVVLDMSELEYLDSSALGMLLMLRERVGGAAVEIANCTPAVFKILSTVKFDKLFTVRQ
jgi:HptB-dependent secretion and biofilm anti anti-sigma factor